MARWRDLQWNLTGDDGDRTVPRDLIQLALLMDIRDELKELNRKFVCGSAVEQRLRGIERAVVKLKAKPRITAKKAAQILARRRGARSGPHGVRRRR